MEKVITLFHGENCYFAINQDAEVVSSLCNVKITSVRETKFSVFSKGELDRILPILVRNGNRVYIVDPRRIKLKTRDTHANRATWKNGIPR